MFWRIEDRDLLVRAFHLHPVLIRPDSWDYVMCGTIDSDYVANAVRETSEIYVVRDSDDIAGAELSGRIEAEVHRSRPNADSGTKRVASWMKRATNPLHRQYVHNKIRLHADEIDAAKEELWKVAEEESSRVLTRIYKDYDPLGRPFSSANILPRERATSGYA